MRKTRKHGDPIIWRGGLQWTKAARMQAARFEHAAMELYSAYFDASMRADLEGHKDPCSLKDGATALMAARRSTRNGRSVSPQRL
ncbi:hypothetical protein ARTSIC4J27_2091 [Pseudarthrobacter siccitolerans]|uniref:Uncharacterized protein n=1 Tax=Pseudarthrobacter siccitolerans TaxID=861266 RepID=A0A024H328_9MICC|nr:hypothetical protein [Pseudarthrobacter siccitolerans]CCQ46131.1 hypothetical protein ARTSIC4J27_2091 [Pseudarthrobacter siccitolerans]